jgi:two-component system OmpR family response regulator
MTSGKASPSVLVIDDNKDMTEMISDYLQSQEIECKVINDGKEGLEEIKSENEYSVIFLDLAMPGFSGYDVFNTLKKEGLVQSKNIIIFTASSITEGEIEEVLSNGAKGILRKPASIDELTEVINRFS